MVNNMTRIKAIQVKSIIREDNYRVYYQSKKEELRVRVYTWTNNYNREDETIAILDLLRKISDFGHRPMYRIYHKVYQGFIHNTYVVFH